MPASAAVNKRRFFIAGVPYPLSPIPFFFPFLPIPYPFWRLLRRLVIAYLHVVHVEQSSFPVHCVHLNHFLFQYCGSLLGRAFCKPIVGDFICSSILPCNNAFVQPFQGTLYRACYVLQELVSLNACSVFSKLYVLECVRCTFTGLLALAIVTVFKNSFLLLLQVKKKKKTEKECKMYVTYRYICNLVVSLFNIVYLHLFHSWTCFVQCGFDAVFFFFLFLLGF